MNKIFINNKTIHSLNINNSGTLNEQNLQFAKTTFLFDNLRKYANKLVKHSQHYPNNDISDVDLKLDIVILSTKEYEYLTSKLNKMQNKLFNPKIKP